jgi:hypothetical protein
MPLAFDESEVMTALCLWEAWLTLEQGDLAEQADLRAKMEELRDANGSFCMRQAMIDITRDCDTAWEAAEALGYDESFDFDFCYEFLIGWINDGRLADRIMQQYQPKAA